MSGRFSNVLLDMRRIFKNKDSSLDILPILRLVIFALTGGGFVGVNRA